MEAERSLALSGRQASILGSQSVVFQPASFENLLEVHVLRCSPRSTESEFLGVGPDPVSFNKLPPQSR